MIIQQPIIKKVKKAPAPDSGGAWKIALADFMTALMCIFFALWATANKSEAERASLADFFKGEEIVEEPQLKLLEAAYEEITKVIDHQDVTISLDKTNKNITIKFDSAMLFKSGSADLKKEAVDSLTRFSEAMKGREFFYHIYGYTDPIPVRKGGKFRSNLELSVMRAMSAGYILNDNGIPPTYMTFHGEGHLNPAKNNDTHESMAANRRVEMYITHSSVPSKVYGNLTTFIEPKDVPSEEGLESVLVESIPTTPLEVETK